MAQLTRHDWHLSQGRSISRRSTAAQSPGRYDRRLRLEPLEDRRLLAVFTVTNNADAGAGSLRQAILAANAAGGADQIVFSSVTGTIGLTTGQLLITDSVTITGPGANLLTLSGNNASRIFEVTDSAATVKTVAVSGLTLAAGAASFGGAIFNQENLSIQGCTIRDNFSSVSGAGAYNSAAGTLNVLSSTLHGNAANGDGGGIVNHGVLNVQNSTISGNAANFSGGAIASFGNTVTVQNSTLTNNRAEADVDAQGEGGGIWFVDTTIRLHNSIVSGNFKFNANVTPSDIVAYNGAVNVVSSNNLIGTGGAGGVMNGFNGNQVGVANVGIGALANNGGPTLTHGLLITSPAFNAGNNAQAPGSTDQRGGAFARIVGGTVDIGAVELQSNLVVDTDVDEDDGNYTPGDLSLREAIALANGFAGADVITFSSFFNTPRTITLNQGQLEIRSDLTITAPGANLLTISGNNASRIFDVTDASTASVRNVTLSGLTLAAGAATYGGAIFSSENLTIQGCAITNNSSSVSGGGIFNHFLGGTLTLHSSTVSGNTADRHGGGIHNDRALTVQNSTISGNAAKGSGGGIYNQGNLTVQNCTITQNRSLSVAASRGGGVALGFTSGTLTLHNSIVAENFFGTDEYNIFASPGQVISVSSNNLIGAGAGGLLDGVNGNLVDVADPWLGPLANNGGPTLTHALLASSPAFNAGNNAQAPGSTDQRGGAIARIANGTVDIGAFEIPPVSSSLVVGTDVDEDDGNYTPGDLSLREAIGLAHGFAGADVITFSSFFNIPRTITLNQGQLEIRSDLTITAPGANLLTISGNDASRIFDVSDSKATVKTVAVSGLTLAAGAATYGGAIYNRENLTIQGCTVRNNVSSVSGAGVYNSATGTLNVQGSTLSGNAAHGDGGGIVNHGVLNVQNSTISGNAANFSGGAIASFGNTVTVQNSTLTNNRAEADVDAQGEGGGIWFVDTTVVLYNSVVSGNYKYNTNATPNNIVAYNGAINPASMNNLIGTGGPGGLTNGVGGNRVGVDQPGLAPLADNGGPTQTHALLAGSLAINAGNPAFAAPPNFDQRGAPFNRVAGGRIDIGAYEVQGGISPTADFDGDNDVDGADFLAWQRGLGAIGVAATHAKGDANGDGVVDGADLGFWRSQFGGPPPGAVASLTKNQTAPPLEAAGGEGREAIRTASISINSRLPFLMAGSPALSGRAAIVAGAPPRTLQATQAHAAPGDSARLDAASFAWADWPSASRRGEAEPMLLVGEPGNANDGDRQAAVDGMFHHLGAVAQRHLGEVEHD